MLDALKDEARKWLPVDPDGRLQGTKEAARFFMYLFGVATFARMMGVDFSKLQLPFGIVMDPQVHWSWFAAATVFCGGVTQRLGHTQDERFTARINGTGGGTRPPGPGA